MRTFRTIALVAAITLLTGCQTKQAALATETYDDRPYNEKPIMERPAWPNYDIDNQNSFAVFSRIMPVKEFNLGHQITIIGQSKPNERYTLYRCKEATYITVDYLVPQDWYFFCWYEGSCIIDCDTGDEYMLRELEHLPLNQCFWVHGMAGKWARFVEVYPPLPASVRRIQLFSPGGPERQWLYPTPSRSKIMQLDDIRPTNAGHARKQGRTIY